jgi:hypothetical protein
MQRREGVHTSKDVSRRSRLCPSQGISADYNGTWSAPNAGARPGSLPGDGSHLLREQARLGPRRSLCLPVPGPHRRAWRTKAKVNARLLGDSDPDQWDLPPKPKGMRWATYEI